MADRRGSDSTKLAASLVGRVAGGPAPGLVAEGEVWVLRLAVPRHLNDLAAGTFRVAVLLCGPPARDLVGRLVEGCPLRVSGPLDVGPCQTVDGGRRWGLQLVARELAIEEIDLADACPPPRGGARRALTSGGMSFDAATWGPYGGPRLVCSCTEEA